MSETRRITEQEVLHRLRPEDYFTADRAQLTRTLDSFAPVFAQLVVLRKPNCGPYAGPDTPYYGIEETEDQVIGCTMPVRAVAATGKSIPVMVFEAIRTVQETHNQSLSAVIYRYVEEGSPGTYPPGLPEWRANVSFMHFRPDCGELQPVEAPEFVQFPVAMIH